MSKGLLPQIAFSACMLLEQGSHARTACQHVIDYHATVERFTERSWLPLYLGDATLYLEACPRMSFFLAGALLTLGFNLLHTSSMVLAFSGWTHQCKERWMAVPCVHLLAALLVDPHPSKDWVHDDVQEFPLPADARLQNGAADRIPVRAHFCPVLA